MNREKLKTLLDYLSVFEMKERDYRSAREQIEKDILAEIGKEETPVRIGGITLNINNGVLVKS